MVLDPLLSKRGGEDLIISCPLLPIFNEDHWANFVSKRHYLRLDIALDLSKRSAAKSLLTVTRFLGHTAGIYGHVTRGIGGHSWSLVATFKPLQSKGLRPKSLERATGIEPAFSACGRGRERQIRSFTAE